jgi:hypothetical protein
MQVQTVAARPRRAVPRAASRAASRAGQAESCPRPGICIKHCPVCGCRFIARDSLADYEIFCRECGD